MRPTGASGDGGRRRAAPGASGARKGRFDHEGVRYRYLMWPARAKAVAAPFVLLHGFAQSAASWDRVARCWQRTESCTRSTWWDTAVPEAPGEPASLRARSCRGEALAGVRPLLRWRPSARRRGRRGRCRPARSCRERNRLALGKRPLATKAPRPGPWSSGTRWADAWPLVPRLCAERDDFAACASALVLEGAGLGPATEAAREQDAARDAKRAARPCARSASKPSWTSGSAFPCSPPSARCPASCGSISAPVGWPTTPRRWPAPFEHAGQHAMPARDQVLAALSAPAPCRRFRALPGGRTRPEVPRFGR